MHTPERMCAVCKKRLPKENLIRIAATPGGAEIDTDGKLQGRGAYLCKDPACISKCVKKRMLDRVMKTEVSSDVYEKLQSFADRQE